MTSSFLTQKTHTHPCAGPRLISCAAAGLFVLLRKFNFEAVALLCKWKSTLRGAAKKRTRRISISGECSDSAYILLTAKTQPKLGQNSTFRLGYCCCAYCRCRYFPHFSVSKIVVNMSRAQITTCYVCSPLIVRVFMVVWFLPIILDGFCALYLWNNRCTDCF